MVNDIKYWELDVHEIGELSEDEQGDDEKKLMKMLTRNGLDDDDAD
jgi:hypothetical protein